MGMFDDYEPVPDLVCPVDGRVIEEWQGKEGPCVLARYRQGEPIGPEGFPVHGHFELHASCLEEDPSGNIYGGLSGKRYRYVHTVEGFGVVRDGVWAETVLDNVNRWERGSGEVVLWKRTDAAGSIPAPAEVAPSGGTSSSADTSEVAA